MDSARNFKIYSGKFADRGKMKTLSSVHGEIVPANIYPTDPISASIQFNSTDDWIPIEIKRVSPLGVDFQLSQKHHPSIAIELDQPSNFSMEIRYGSHRVEISNLKVSNTHDSNCLLSCSWPEITTTDEPRKFKIGDHYLPYGVVNNPLLHGDKIVFRVNRISNRGATILYSLRNKHLFPGIILEGVLTLPTMKDARINLKITSAKVVEINGEKFLESTIIFQNLEKDLSKNLGQYIFQFGEKTTVTDLWKSRLPVPKTSQALKFGYVSSEKEYDEVLKLRKRAYVGSGKIDKEADYTSMGDSFDSRARILVAQYRGDIVGSMRLMFHENSDEMEHDRFMDASHEIPPKDQIVEVTRICNHPDFRKSDLFYGMMAHMAILIVQSGRPWLLGCSTLKLLPMYKKIGARTIGTPFKHTDLGGEEHHLILVDVPKMMKGYGINPIVWNLLFKEVTEYLHSMGALDYELSDKLRLFGYQRITPLAEAVKKRRYG